MMKSRLSFSPPFDKQIITVSLLSGAQYRKKKESVYTHKWVFFSRKDKI